LQIFLSRDLHVSGQTEAGYPEFALGFPDPALSGSANHLFPDSTLYI
jgi:hypothetical protein